MAEKSNKFEDIRPTIQKELNDMEAYRQECKKEFYKKIFITFIICIAIDILSAYLVSYLVHFLLCVINIFVFFIYFSKFKNSARNKVNAYYKNKIVTKMIFANVENAQYLPNQCVSSDKFDQTRLYGGYDRYSGENLICGKISKTVFEFSGIKVEVKEKDIRRKNNTRWVPIFSGIIFIADFNKKFKGTTLLSSRSNKFFSLYNSKKTKMENINFNNIFKTYTTDELEARYILTPSIMEKLLEIRNKLGKPIEVSFNNSNVAILVHTSHNYFEAKLFSPMKNSDIQNDYVLIKNMTGIIEDLNLNTRIWSKE